MLLYLSSTHIAAINSRSYDNQVSSLYRSPSKGRRRTAAHLSKSRRCRSRNASRTPEAAHFGREIGMPSGGRWISPSANNRVASRVQIERWAGRRPHLQTFDHESGGFCPGRLLGYRAGVAPGRPPTGAMPGGRGILPCAGNVFPTAE